MGTPRLTPDEHHRRAAERGIEWLEVPVNKETNTPARCIGCAHEWTPRPGNVYQGNGCPRCAAIQSGKAQRIAADEHHRRAAAAGIEWLEAPARTTDPTPARCLECGHEWKPRPSNVYKGHGCPRCAGVVRVTPEQYATRAAAVGIEWLETPAHTLARTPARCLRCDYGADGTWTPWASTIYMGRGCPRCAGILPITPEEHHRRAAAAGVAWLEPPTNTRLPTPARCLTCGYGEDRSWSPWPIAVYRGHGCPECAGNAPIAPEQYAARAAAVDIEWLAVPAGANSPTPARCLVCGHGEDRTWTPWPSGVRDGSGCPACAGYGFDPSLPAVLYVVINDAARIGKFGITASESGRIAKHGRDGFDRLALCVDYAHGHLAREDEQRIRDAVLQVSPAAIMRGREYVDLDVVPESDLVALIEGVAGSGDAGGVIIERG